MFLFMFFLFFIFFFFLSSYFFTSYILIVVFLSSLPRFFQSLFPHQSLHIHCYHQLLFLPFILFFHFTHLLFSMRSIIFISLFLFLSFLYFILIFLEVCMIYFFYIRFSPHSWYSFVLLLYTCLPFAYVFFFSLYIYIFLKTNC